MNRLVTRLVLAMLAVALFSAGVIVISQFVGARLQVRSLPADVRADVLRRDRRGPPRDAPANDDGVGSRQRDSSGPPPDFVRRDEFVRGLANVRASQRRATYVGLGIAALLATLVAVYLARTISRPIEGVSRAAAEVAEGNLNVRVPETTLASLEVRALSQTFNAMATSLQAGEQQRRAMIADIAHELRTPLAAMNLRFQALEDDLLPFDKEQVRRLHVQTDLLTRLVQDLRTLSLADAGRLSLDKREVDLVSLLNAVCDSYQEKAVEGEVGLEFEPAVSTLVAHVDPERVTQIVSNLLDNALRVTPAEGTVTVSLAEEDNAALLRVIDTGPGLPEETIEHLFDRFFQDRDTKGSSGLGLAIVKALAELHGGSVVASNTASGAQFEVRLPRHAQT